MSNYFFETGHKTHCLVLHGLGGSGKSDIARNFAHTHFYSLLSDSPRFSEVYYVDATMRATMTESLQNIALAAGVGGSSSDALHHLENQAPPTSNWLVVYDNADDPKIDLNEYLPACTHGNIIITTRNYETRLYGVRPQSDIEVSDMTLLEALQLLLARIDIEETAEETTLVAAKQLIQELHCFPLSIHQASAYMRAQSCSIPRYRSLFRQRRNTLYQEHGNRVQGADTYRYRSTHATWLISYEQLSPFSSLLFRLWSFYHHNGIKECYLKQAHFKIGEYSDPAIPLTDKQRAALFTAQDLFNALSYDGEWSSLRFSALISELRSSSLVTYDKNQDAYSIHPLVHQWTRRLSLPSTHVQLCTSILLGACIPRGPTYDEYIYRKQLLLHLDSALTGLELGLIDTSSAHAFLAVYADAGKHEQCVALLLRTVEVRRTVLGEEHPHTLTSMNELGHIYRKQGHYAKAESLHLRILDARREMLGEEHPDTLTSTNKLALTYWKQGYYVKAKLLEIKVLEARRKVLGENHPDTLTSMSNLALTYSKQGCYAKAVSLEVKALEARRKLLGEEHPDTLISMNNLAQTYCNQGKGAQAEPIQVKVLEARRKVLGEEHPDTLASMNNLAITYLNQQHYTDAESLATKSFELYTKVLGANHPETRNSLQTLRAVQVTIWANGTRKRERKGFMDQYREMSRKVKVKFRL